MSPFEGVAQDAVVGVSVVGARLPAGHELGALADHLVGLIHRRDTERDGLPGDDSKSEVVRQRSRVREQKRGWGPPQADDDLRGRQREALSGADVERNAVPPHRINAEPDSGERLDLRIDSDATSPAGTRGTVHE